MKSQVMERPHMARAHHPVRRRALLGAIRIAAILERKSELELSDDQLKKLMNIRADMIRAKARLTGEIRVARLELIYSTAMNIGNINPDQLRSAIKNIYNLRLERKAATIDAFKQASEVLSSEQKETLRELTLERLADYETEMGDSFMED
jgi:transcription initiation factor IIE alpha subunit